MMANCRKIHTYVGLPKQIAYIAKYGPASVYNSGTILKTLFDIICNKPPNPHRSCDFMFEEREGEKRKFSEAHNSRLAAFNEICQDMKHS